MFVGVALSVVLVVVVGGVGGVGAVEGRGYPFRPFSAEEVQQAVSKGVDWRAKGAVPSVRNQGTMGSVAPLVAVATIESQWKIHAGGALTPLSTQQLLMCNKGTVVTATDDFAYAASVGGLMTAAAFPGTVRECAFDPKKVAAQVSNYTVAPREEGQLAAFVARNGPMAVTVDASTWQEYVGGVKSDCPAHVQLDHEALLVGIGHEGGVPYWLLQNTWGETWGEKGYIRLAYGSNQCGVAFAASAPTVGNPAKYFDSTRRV